MVDPSTFEGEFFFDVEHMGSMGTCPGDTALTSRTDTQGTSHPSSWVLTHDQFPAVRYDNSYFTESPTFSIAHSLMALEASAPAPAGNFLGTHGTPSPVHTLSSNTTSGPSHTSVSTAVPAASNTAISAAGTHVPTRRRFNCPLPACPRSFDRLTRANACHNKHLDLKPHICNGACGNATCNAAYGSIENLDRHLRVLAERKVACSYCALSFLRQNISRHKKSCVKVDASS